MRLFGRDEARPTRAGFLRVRLHDERDLGPAALRRRLRACSSRSSARAPRTCSLTGTTSSSPKTSTDFPAIKTLPVGRRSAVGPSVARSRHDGRAPRTCRADNACLGPAPRTAGRASARGYQVGVSVPVRPRRRRSTAPRVGARPRRAKAGLVRRTSSPPRRRPAVFARRRAEATPATSRPGRSRWASRAASSARAPSHRRGPRPSARGSSPPRGQRARGRSGFARPFREPPPARLGSAGTAAPADPTRAAAARRVASPAPAAPCSPILTTDPALNMASRTLKCSSKLSGSEKNVSTCSGVASVRVTPMMRWRARRGEHIRAVGADAGARHRP